MPDELKGGPTTEGPPASPAPLASDADGKSRRKPSWLRAALISLMIVAVGVLLGAMGYRLERATSLQPPAIEETGDGWRITARRSHELSGLALNGPRLLWQDGASVEYMHLGDGEVRLLGPGPGMHTTWDPAVGPRYAVWFEAERPGSLAAHAVAYDTESGRRWTVSEVGSVRSYPSISGDVAVWCSAQRIGVPTINGVRVGGGEPFQVASGSGAPVVSGGLVVWALDWTGPFSAAELAGDSSWPVSARLTADRLTGIALAGQTLVWGQASDEAGSGVVATVDVEAGQTTTLATGLTGLAGPAYDGRTVVWAEKTASGARVMGRHLGGAAFPVATVAGTVSEVAVSGDTVAWISRSGDRSGITTASLPQ